MCDLCHAHASRVLAGGAGLKGVMERIGPDQRRLVAATSKLAAGHATYPATGWLQSALLGAPRAHRTRGAVTENADLENRIPHHPAGGTQVREKSLLPIDVGFV